MCEGDLPGDLASGAQRGLGEACEGGASEPGGCVLGAGCGAQEFGDTAEGHMPHVVSPGEPCADGGSRGGGLEECGLEDGVVAVVVVGLGQVCEGGVDRVAEDLGVGIEPHSGAGWVGGGEGGNRGSRGAGELFGIGGEMGRGGVDEVEQGGRMGNRTMHERLDRERLSIRGEQVGPRLERGGSAVGSSDALGEQLRERFGDCQEDRVALRGRECGPGSEERGPGGLGMRGPAGGNPLKQLGDQTIAFVV